MINIFQPALGKEELDAVSEVFASNWIGKGKQVQNFEEQFASHLKTPRSNFLSLTACTEALFLSPKLFGIGNTD
ncbi:MAG: DegT/DnrJ/EryC1/StrS aminotransferase family protein [Proteobacteria bacterium]|nr:MAG: DegT/DnrJ/EryC1/StrS aminotransferase family protein [Pseudomonadota bacterium]